MLSILTVILVLAGILNFSVAEHYCRGELVATKVSLTGTLATCGMESSDEVCHHGQHGDLFESHCCDDVLTSYGIDNNYTPAAKQAPEFSGAKIAVPDLPFQSPVRSFVIINQNWSDISPPALLITTSVDLSQIRVLRI